MKTKTAAIERVRWRSPGHCRCEKLTLTDWGSIKEGCQLTSLGEDSGSQGTLSEHSALLERIERGGKLEG